MGRANKASYRVLGIRKKRGRHEQKTKIQAKITRVKLNYEQAVLTCDCYNVGRHIVIVGGGTDWGVTHHPVPYLPTTHICFRGKGISYLHPAIPGRGNITTTN